MHLHVKDSRGHHNWQGTLILWPYSYGSRFISSARRKWSKETLYTKILDGWLLAADSKLDTVITEWNCKIPEDLLPSDKFRDSQQIIQELPKHVTTAQEHYLTTPVWDTFGFTIEQITQGSKWAVKQRDQGLTVYVHCAYGHGRSCTMLCACLVEAGHFPNFIAAFRHVSSLRPRAYINNRQKEPLMQWSRARGDQLPNDINTMPREAPPELGQATLNELAKQK